MIVASNLARAAAVVGVDETTEETHARPASFSNVKQYAAQLVNTGAAGDERVSRRHPPLDITMAATTNQMRIRKLDRLWSLYYWRVER